MDNVKRQKHPKARIVVLSVVALLIIAALAFMHFGGFGTGNSADPAEFAAYAGSISDITIPENTKIVALGEATHGNVEFQQLKLDVFRHLVENYGVRAFALEGDYGGCEYVNRYIHGGEGSAEEAAAAIGFAIYRTNEMAELISYMREYNNGASAGDDLRFYGFDMQRAMYSYEFLLEACTKLGVDTADIEKLVAGDDWSDGYDYPQMVEIITAVKTVLEGKENATQAIHLADMLLQYCELQTVEAAQYGDVRDGLMAKNTLWITEQEKQTGHDRIFVSAHNGHVARWGSYDAMGKLLSKELGENYYVIGTDFYKTSCNMPGGSSCRTNQTFYSHDPLAKAAKLAGLDVCWLDFAKASQSPELLDFISDYVFMGSLGEGYSLLMRLLPPSYRIFQMPNELYDGMIFVSDAHPTEIKNAE